MTLTGILPAVDQEVSAPDSKSPLDNNSFRAKSLKIMGNASLGTGTGVGV